jgi:hypothetical protein
LCLGEATGYKIAPGLIGGKLSLFYRGDYLAVWQCFVVRESFD